MFIALVVVYIAYCALQIVLLTLHYMIPLEFLYLGTDRHNCDDNRLPLAYIHPFSRLINCIN